MSKRLSSQAAHQHSKRVVWVHCLNCRKGSSTKYLIQKDNKTVLQIVSLVDVFFSKPQCLLLYGLDDLHATESGADGAVLASGIAARLHFNSWMDIRHLLTIGTS